MKRKLIVLLICIAAILGLTLTACTDDKGGTYYPNNAAMKANLENSGYTVEVTTDLGEKSGTRLSATKGNEYIEFYRLDNSADCEYYYDILENSHNDYNSLVMKENDEKFGNIVYCGTEKAIIAAGIKVVDMKVTVKSKNSF